MSWSLTRGARLGCFLTDDTYAASSLCYHVRSTAIRFVSVRRIVSVSSPPCNFIFPPQTHHHGRGAPLCGVCPDMLVLFIFAPHGLWLSPIFWLHNNMGYWYRNGVLVRDWRCGRTEGLYTTLCWSSRPNSERTSTWRCPPGTRLVSWTSQRLLQFLLDAPLSVALGNVPNATSSRTE